MRVDINLASHPYQDARKFWTYWGTGLGLLGLITLMMLYLAITGYVRAGKDRQQIAKLQSEIAAYDAERAQSESLLNQPQNRTMREQSGFLNEVFQQKSFSWTRVFEHLERVMPAHLHVVSIHPDMAADNDAELKLTVGGDSRDQALDLVKKMEGSKCFKQTRIESERFNTEQRNNMDPVQFEIVTLYVPCVAESETSGGVN